MHSKTLKSKRSLHTDDNGEDDIPSSMESDPLQESAAKSHQKSDGPSSEWDSPDMVTIRSGWPTFPQEELFGARYTEPARPPPPRRVLTLCLQWQTKQNVVEVTVLGQLRTYVKRSDRSCPNPWRRHGPLMKIHEIGGWISTVGKEHTGNRRDRKYYYVKAGSMPCVAPVRPPIVIRESKFLPSSAIKVPTNVSVSEMATSVARQIQLFLAKKRASLRKIRPNVIALDRTPPVADRLSDSSRENDVSSTESPNQSTFQQDLTKETTKPSREYVDQGMFSSPKLPDGRHSNVRRNRRPGDLSEQ